MALVLMCASGAASAGGQTMDVPVALQVPLFLKVLSFDRQLSARAAGTLVIAIVYQSGFRSSGQAKDEWLRAAGTLPHIDALAIRYVVIDLDREALAEALARCKATVVYLTPVRGVDLNALATTTRAARVTTITGVARYVEQGLSIGVRLHGERPQILVNLLASRAEGAEFGSELLKLVHVQ